MSIDCCLGLCWFSKVLVVQHQLVSPENIHTNTVMLISTGEDHRHRLFKFRLNEFILSASRTASLEPKSMTCHTELRERFIRVDIKDVLYITMTYGILSWARKYFAVFGCFCFPCIAIKRPFYHSPTAISRLKNTERRTIILFLSHLQAPRVPQATQNPEGITGTILTFFSHHKGVMFKLLHILSTWGNFSN